MTERRYAVGDRLPNGAVVIAQREVNGSWLVISHWPRGNGSYVTWKLDITGHTYGGHYFDVVGTDELTALDAAIADFKRRM